MGSGTAQVLYNFTSSKAYHRIWLSAGLGVVRHGGPAYQPYGSPTSLAGVFGVGSTFPLAHRLNFTAGLTTMVYNLAVVDGAGATVQAGRQVDLRLQTGITLTFSN